MAKIYTWETTETVLCEETEEEKTVTHAVCLRCSYLTGKAKITIDGTEFDIGTRPMGLRGTNQMFRLGDQAAILDFPKKGAPNIIVDGEPLPRKK
ncbi:MAG: hypothetical protein IJY47_00195 [Clostridia bacterium]|nr:hypothetical protein [Clostridia bacterium]